MYSGELSLKQQFIIVLSLLFLAISVGMDIKEYEDMKEDYTLNYEYVNIKDMAQARVATKESNPGFWDEIITNLQNSFGYVEEVLKGSKLEEVSLPATEDSTNNSGSADKRVWYLPTEYGQISQYPNYNHVAYDIYSWRGTAETIHPVANGVISGIYTDSFGGLTVTVLHEVNGKKYTSQYVHLSSYASGIYVGKPVTINDALGQMGTTGWSTGVHLHLTVLDCALFDPNDPNCSSLGAWYVYDKTRLSQNFYGLGSLMYVPESWSNR